MLPTWLHCHQSPPEISCSDWKWMTSGLFVTVNGCQCETLVHFHSEQVIAGDVSSSDSWQWDRVVTCMGLTDQQLCGHLHSLLYFTAINANTAPSLFQHVACTLSVRCLMQWRALLQYRVISVCKLTREQTEAQS